MDGGPFRVPQPADNRRVASRSEAASRPSEEPQQPIVKEEPKTVYRSEEPRRTVREKRSLKKLIISIIVLVVILALGFIGWTTWSNSHASGPTGIDTSKYQAVFFTNGQVYFGKLQAFNNDTMKLTDIFYLQTQTADTSNTSLQKTATDQSSSVQLIKLGSEVHGPEDSMILEKNQVLFYENLKPDGKVAQSIANYKKSAK
ncbi:MAG: hypothetical protein JWO99_822 [Candidatus Saccharibacteria bacterium]|nr:hypothetical protein [Candidatus Saccharibacteria bacterium]